MDFEFDCPACGHPIASPVEYAGLEGECAACHHPFVIPSAPLAQAVQETIQAAALPVEDPADASVPAAPRSSRAHRPKPIVSFPLHPSFSELDSGSADSEEESTPPPRRGPSVSSTENLSDEAAASAGFLSPAPPTAGLASLRTPRAFTNVPAAPFPPRDVTTVLPQTSSDEVSSTRQRAPFPPKEAAAPITHFSSHALDAIPSVGLSPSATIPPEEAAETLEAHSLSEGQQTPIAGAPAAVRVAPGQAPIRLIPPPLIAPPAPGLSPTTRRRKRRRHMAVFGAIAILAVGGLFALAYWHSQKVASEQFGSAWKKASDIRSRLASQISYRNDKEGIRHNLAEIQKVCDSLTACSTLPYARNLPTTDLNDAQRVRKLLQQDLNIVEGTESVLGPRDVQIARVRRDIVTYAERFAPDNYTIDTPPPDDPWSKPNLHQIHEGLKRRAEDLLDSIAQMDKQILLIDLVHAHQQLSEEDIEKYLAIASTKINKQNNYRELLERMMGHAIKLAPLMADAAHRQYVDDFAHRRLDPTGAFFLGRDAPQVPPEVQSDIRKNFEEVKKLKIVLPPDHMDFAVQCRAWRQIQWIVGGGLKDLPDAEREFYRYAVPQMMLRVSRDYVAILEGMGGCLRFTQGHQDTDPQ